MKKKKDEWVYCSPENKTNELGNMKLHIYIDALTSDQYIEIIKEIEKILNKHLNKSVYEFKYLDPKIWQQYKFNSDDANNIRQSFIPITVYLTNNDKLNLKEIATFCGQIAKTNRPWFFIIIKVDQDFCSKISSFHKSINAISSEIT